MATPVILPKQGNTVESCLIMAWKKNIGEAVTQGDILVEVETDKAIVQIESPSDGTLLTQFFGVGDDVPVMTNIAVVGNEGEAVDEFRPQIEQQDAAGAAPAQPKKPEPMKQSAPAPSNGVTGSMFISPRARMLADQHGIDIGQVVATGPEGRIIERDIKQAIANQPRMTKAAQTQAASGGFAVPQRGTGIGGRVTRADLSTPPPSTTQADEVTEIPLRGIRKTIADRMRGSLQDMAQLTLNTSADARAMLAYRKRLKHSDAEMGLQTISINDLLLFVVSRVLLDYPELNSTLSDNTIRQYGNVNLGFAVDTERGLLVPVIRNAHQLSLKELSQETTRLATAVQDGSISADEMSDGTFTVSNLGALGIESFTPIINPPQVAILGVGKADLKPVQVGDEVEFSPHMHLSLTIDHQIVDGAPGARFLRSLTQAMANVDLWLAQ